ncbi:MAG TPA: hypothetical protein VKS81_01645 [Bacteroidota bacterium]|nr:hypothetical protein [Bacteroidota bacterium]
MTTYSPVLNQSETSALPKKNGVRTAWLVAANMGYGHLRAIFPLKGIVHEEIVILGENDNSKAVEKKLWEKLLVLYSRFSRAKGIPGIGKYLFKILNRFLYIPSVYPVRNLSQATFQVDLLATFIRKGLCAGILGKINDRPLPLVTSFYAPAIAAEMSGHHPTYCIICDADLNRVWVPKEPSESNITYFAPCGKSAQRLQAYGVPNDRIVITGFPLPGELLGGKSLPILKSDLRTRLRYLDPNGRFWQMHSRNVEYFLGKERVEREPERALTLMYAVGGAGAQREIGRRIAFSIRERLSSGQIRLILAAGTNFAIRDYFEELRIELGHAVAENVSVIYADIFEEYYTLFNRSIRTTDILWTKPSELSFYCALGIPIIISPIIGSQEYFNRKWLLEIRAGFKQDDPDYADQWLFELLNKGLLAEASWAGFLKARKLGTYKILDIIAEGKVSDDDSPLLR